VPPVWFADSEETSITNAVQILSNTEGLDNHVLHQVLILLRELCRLHAVPEPPDLDRLHIPDPQTTNRISNGDELMEDEGLDSEAEGDIADSDAEEDSDADEDLAMEMEDSRPKADEMGVEHLATLERLRQNQRQEYLKVKKKHIHVRSSSFRTKIKRLDRTFCHFVRVVAICFLQGDVFRDPCRGRCKRQTV
jgi:ubiquitin-conjugating enzyme E2 Q